MDKKTEKKNEIQKEPKFPGTEYATDISPVTSKVKQTDFEKNYDLELGEISNNQARRQDLNKQDNYQDFEFASQDQSTQFDQNLMSGSQTSFNRIDQRETTTNPNRNYEFGALENWNNQKSGIMNNSIQNPEPFKEIGNQRDNSFELGELNNYDNPQNDYTRKSVEEKAVDQFKNKDRFQS